MIAIHGWLIRADDPATGVKFEEFFAGDQASEMNARIEKHFSVYPDVNVYVIGATEYQSG